MSWLYLKPSAASWANCGARKRMLPKIQMLAFGLSTRATSSIQPCTQLSHSRLVSP